MPLCLHHDCLAGFAVALSLSPIPLTLLRPNPHSDFAFLAVETVLCYLTRNCHQKSSTKDLNVSVLITQWVESF